MLITNTSLLYGEDLRFVERADIVIANGRFIEIRERSTLSNMDYEKIIDAEGMLMIPAFINAHTHIGDAIAKDIAIDLGFNESIHPEKSVKKNVLERSESSHLIAYMRTAMLSMLKKGITTFADFREGGIEGISLLRRAMKDMSIRGISLGRIPYYFEPEYAKLNADLPMDIKMKFEAVLDSADGLGISGANEYSNRALAYFNSLAKAQTNVRKIIAIHAAESKESYRSSLEIFGVSEVYRIMKHLKPDMIVHMTNASEEDIAAASKTGIVVCPRANGALGVGIPNIEMMLKHNCRVAIGTDNVMLNSPDLFREMDYIWKVTTSTGYKLKPKEVLKMVTVNPARMLGLNDLGYIENDMVADAIFIDKHSIDLEPMHDPYASIVHRADESCIKAVLFNGRFVHGSL